MDYFAIDNGVKRQQRIREKHRAAAKSRRLFLFCFSCICIAALLLIAGFYLKASFHNSQREPLLSSLFVGKDYEQEFSAVPNEDSKNIVDERQWCLILVNKWNQVPDDYRVNLTKLANGQRVDARIYPALQKMFDAARAEGFYPIVAAGYRTAGKQQRLMDAKIVELQAEGYSQAEAKSEAERWVAVPGSSEHQLGIAVDINADSIHSAGYELYGWLGENAHNYGFILRYPENKEGITGTAYEEWHYRYVGIEAAREIYEKGLCLEEYLAAT